MTDTVYDMVVLGAGSGGYAAALRGAQLGLRVALIEADKVGGTCLHRGCVPTKALLHAAETADAVRGARALGVDAELRGVDMAALNAYKDSVVTRMHKGLQGLVASRGIDLIAGRGRLAGADAVEVDGRAVRGRNIVLATGSYSKTLGQRIDERVLTSEGALRLERVPASAVVLGGGVIFASSLIPGNENSVYRVINQLMRLGARVVHQGNARVHVSGHASSEELLHVYNIVSPRNVMPIHGEIRHLVANGALAVKTGVAPENVVLCEDGVTVDLLRGRARVSGQVPCGYVYVDGSSVGEIDETELKDRRILAEEGFVSVYAVVETKTGTILAGPDIQARGVAEDDSVFDEILPEVTDVLQAALDKGHADAHSLQQVMRRALGRFVGRRLRRRPMIVPVVIEA